MTYCLETDKDGKKQVVKRIQEFFASINGIDNATKQQLLSFLSSKNSDFVLFEDMGCYITLKAKYEYAADEKLRTSYFPDIVDDLNGRLCYIIDPVSYIQEPASLFMIQYCFSMLSRYSPDIWMKLIKENIVFTEFVETLLQIIGRKFPILILDQMTRIKHFIHI